MDFEDRLKKMAEARNNPCNEGEHEYQHFVVPVGKATMLNQVCYKCFDMMGWIENWQGGLSE